MVTSVTYGRRVESVEEWVVKENMASMDCESALPTFRFLDFYIETIGRFNKVIFSKVGNSN